MFLHLPCLLPNPLTHFQWCSLWKCQPVSALLKGTRNSGSSRLGLSVEGGAAPPRGQQDGVHRGSVELGRQLLLSSVGTYWAPDVWVQARGGNAGAEKDKEDQVMKDLGLWDGYWQVSLLPFCSVAKSCPTLCNHVDHSPPGSSAHGILQARILEWVAMPSSKGSSQPRNRTRISYVSCIGRRVLYH